MGRNTRKISFLNKYGGQSEGTPPLNIGNEKECLYAYNVYFDVKEGKAAIIKRKGYKKLNSISIGQKIVHISQFSINSVNYVMCVGEDGTFYSVDPETGTTAITRVGTADKQKWSSCHLSGKQFVANPFDGIFYTTDNITWTAVPDAPIAGLIITFKNRIVAAGITAEPNTRWWSGLGDGLMWDINDSIIPAGYEPSDVGDTDHIIGFGVIGEQLLEFKQHMFHRIFSTDDADNPFRFIPVYGGVGAESNDAIKRIQIDNTDYLMFIGDRGIFIVGISGNAIDITDRVQNSYNTINKDKLSNCILVENPRNRTVYLAYPEGSQFNPTKQLVLSMKTKSWSTYNIPMTAAITYQDDAVSHIMFGDKDGYLYKHDWRGAEVLTDYADDTEAIVSFWQSNFYDYGRPMLYKQIFSMSVRIRATSPDCPIVMSKITEDANSVSDSVSSLYTTGASYGTAIFSTDVFAPAFGYLETQVRSRLYGKSIATRFENSTLNQSMVIYGWIDELKFTDNAKGV